MRKEIVGKFSTFGKEILPKKVGGKEGNVGVPKWKHCSRLTPFYKEPLYKLGWCQRGAVAPYRHLNFHAPSALHKVRAFSFLFSHFRQYDRHCQQRFLDTAHCRHFDSSSPPPQQFFSGAITVCK